jgi:hypothetical protein
MKIICLIAVLAIISAVLSEKMNASDAFILVLVLVGTFAL